MQRNRPDAAVFVLRDATVDSAGIVQEGPQDVRIEDDVDRVPLAGFHLVRGAGNRRGHASGHLRERRAAAASRWRRAASSCGAASAGRVSRRGRRRRRRNPDLASTCGTQTLSRRLLALGVDRHAIRGEVRRIERDEDALQPAVGGLFRPEQDTRRAARRTAELGTERDVLVGLVEDQPSAAAAGRSDDLAVLRAPLHVAERPPSRQARAFEDDVGHEVLRGALREGGRDHEGGGDRRNTRRAMTDAHHRTFRGDGSD